MPRTNPVTQTYCDNADCDLCAGTHNIAGADMDYCYQCDRRTPRATMRVCVQCAQLLCHRCLPRNHAHTGSYCDDCGFNVLEGQRTTECEHCDVVVCEYHRDNHTACEFGDYDSEDDGRYNGRPPVTGYGREATLQFIDEPYVFDPRARGQRSAAIEIEAEYNSDHPNPQRLTLSPYVGITGDGSLRNGIEVTTPPAKGKVLADIITDTMTLMREAGYEGQQSCGMHTHIDLRDKVQDRKFMSHLFNAFFAVEDILYAMQSHSRHNSSYSIPLRTEFKFFDTYGQKSGDFDYTIYKQPKTMDGHYTMEREKQRKYATNRYSAFNFHSVYFRGSLECRLHQGSVDETDALMWIDLLQSIIARVERGHSYKAMADLTRMTVTEAKIKRFARYFDLTTEQREWVMSRVRTGQGMGWALPVSVAWGQPVKGRPKKHEPSVRRNMRFRDQLVECVRCAYQFVLATGINFCPGCDRSLVDRYGSMWYSRVPSSAARSRPRRTARVSFNWDDIANTTVFGSANTTDNVYMNAFSATRISDDI